MDDIRSDYEKVKREWSKKSVNESKRPLNEGWVFDGIASGFADSLRKFQIKLSDIVTEKSEAGENVDKAFKLSNDLENEIERLERAKSLSALLSYLFTCMKILKALPKEYREALSKSKE